MKIFHNILFYMAKYSALRMAEQRKYINNSIFVNLLHKKQLESLNIIWKDAWSNVPYYTNLKREYSLPPQFSSLSEFFSIMPRLSRQTLQDKRELFLRKKKPEFYLETGGSTGGHWSGADACRPI